MLFSILFNLLLANITILLCFFFLFLVVFNKSCKSLLKVFYKSFTSPVDNENLRLRLALAIPTGVPITALNEAIEMLPLVADKTIKDYQNNKNRQYPC